MAAIRPKMRFFLTVRRGLRTFAGLPWGHSSAGRALAWHARGRRFDPAWLHQLNQIVAIGLPAQPSDGVQLQVQPVRTASPSDRALRSPQSAGLTGSY